MNSANDRPAFAEFLDELASGDRDPEKWRNLVITHYFDERLEEIRREVVRMAVSETFDLGQLKIWADELRASISTDS